MPSWASGAPRRRAFAFAVPEATDGRTDHDGDGDTDDSVVFAWDPHRGTVNLRVAVETVNVCCYTDTYHLAAVPGGDVAFLVPEAGQGGTDRNGDGDTGDCVVAVWDHTTGAVSNAGLDATTVEGLSDGRLAVITSESVRRALGAPAALVIDRNVPTWAQSAIAMRGAMSAR